MTNSTAAAAAADRLVPNNNDLNPQQTGDLLGRLQSFLPQMRAANQALEDNEDVDFDPRVDVDLQQEEDDDGEADEDDEDEDESKVDDDDDDGSEVPVEDNHKRNGSSQHDEQHHPTIQIQFELGDVDKNPILSSLLADDQDENDDDDSSDANDLEHDTDYPANSLVSNLLTTTSTITTTTSQPQSSSASSPKRKLITELE